MYRSGVSESHIRLNPISWDQDAPNWVSRGRDAWAADEITWGWNASEAELNLLPDVDGADVIELGCGTAYVSSWLVRRGSRVVGLDISSRQLASARMLQEEFNLPFPLVQADGERLPFRDMSFDFAISEYGIGLWCDPYRWIPECARVLRPGGRLLFISISTLAFLCFPTEDDTALADTSLHRDYFGMHRFEWHNEQGVVDTVGFHLGYGDMIRLLRSSGFEIEDLVEIRAPSTRMQADIDVSWDWARRWPSVEAWKARKPY
ncbi:MAG: class I SAM-dependent methyltransferase [Actinobacteria bacterium]|nr:class I SAM-dependent methyltransferase [Actinomycetota bacterium]